MAPMSSIVAAPPHKRDYIVYCYHSCSVGSSVYFREYHLVMESHQGNKSNNEVGNLKSNYRKSSLSRILQKFSRPSNKDSQSSVSDQSNIPASTTKNRKSSLPTLFHPRQDNDPRRNLSEMQNVARTTSTNTSTRETINEKHVQMLINGWSPPRVPPSGSCEAEIKYSVHKTHALQTKDLRKTVNPMGWVHLQDRLPEDLCHNDFSSCRETLKHGDNQI